MADQKRTLSDAINLWNANRQDEARTVLKEVLAAQPRHEKAWLWLARMAKSPQTQYQALAKVLEINPGNAVAQRVMRERFPAQAPTQQRIEDMLGDAAFADDWRKAEAIYYQILEIEPLQAQSIEALLDHYAHVGDWNQGFRLVQETLRSTRQVDDHFVRRTLEFAMKAKNPEFLRSLDSILLKHQSVAVDDLLQASGIFATAKQYDVVARLLERAAELEPENQTVLYGLASAYDVTKRHAEAKVIRRRIADVDRHSSLGKNMMSRFLEEDPYVPLSMRENTLVAVREAVGLALPFVILLFLDNGMSFIGIDRFLGVLLAFGGGYLLVTATSSHEQKFWKRLIPEGLDDTLRYAIGITGTLVILAAVYLSLRTSIDHVGERKTWENQACEELIVAIQIEFEMSGDEAYRREAPCDWLRDRLYEYYYFEE